MSDISTVHRKAENAHEHIKGSLKNFRRVQKLSATDFMSFAVLYRRALAAQVETMRETRERELIHLHELF